MGKYKYEHEAYVGEIHENQKFGMLTTVRLLGKTDRNAYIWECKCECGNIKNVLATNLRSGNTRSCGCGMIKNQKKIKYVKLSHGCARDRLYNVWSSIKQRCNDKSRGNYYLYGGRGIKMCAEWNDFENFRKWAIENGYDYSADYMKCTIDRIDPNGNYEPGNCRWVEQKIQSRNTRRNVYITQNGETHCITEWAEILNMSKGTLESRYLRGLPPDQILYKGDFRRSRAEKI